MEKDIIGEADDMGRLRYLENKALLAVIQQADLDNMGKHRIDEMLMDNKKALAKIFETFTMDEARYYVKFAVAAYGDNGIKSSQLDMGNGSFDWRRGEWTATRVSEHTGIPVEDLIALDVAYDGDPKQLRHFVAVDRSHKKVILAIRGTYTHREVMIDFNGYSREFLGGESHAAISLMSERLWEKSGDQIIELLDKNPGYELIVVGHSLGGGSTCCVNLILHNDARMTGRKFRGFAYAAPPVYAPLSVVSKEAQTCVNFINQYDAVPFLCGDTVRHQMAMIAAVDKAKLDLVQRAKLLLGMEKPRPAIVQQIHDIQRLPLPVAKDGCPRGMSIPVAGNIWIWPDESRKDTYTAVVADSLKMTETGIFIHKNDFTDHLPARYEYVLNHFEDS
jgi:hypothetical protein